MIFSMAEGKHFLKLSVGYIQQLLESEIEFNVSSSSVLRVTNVYNYPNPFGERHLLLFSIITAET
jgi:hypothetical protein